MAETGKPEEPGEPLKKKGGKTGFYIFLALLLLCLAAYAGTPFFVKKLPQAVEAPKPWPVNR
jgi:hypothetical protein